MHETNGLYQITEFADHDVSDDGYRCIFEEKEYYYARGKESINRSGD